jgi:hypothetical protein
VDYQTSKNRLENRGDTNHLDSDSNHLFKKRSFLYDNIFKNRSGTKVTIHTNIELDDVLSKVDKLIALKDRIGNYQDIDLIIGDSRPHTKPSKRSGPIDEEKVLDIIKNNLHLNNAGIAALAGISDVSVGKIKSKSKAQAVIAAPKFVVSKTTVSANDSLYSRIIDLANYGKSVRGIAKELNISESKVLAVVPKLR